LLLLFILGEKVSEEKVSEYLRIQGQIQGGFRDRGGF
jgi:hypothetical protein